MGRLAIDAKAQGSGLGRFLVRDAILSTPAAADRIGVRILLVHALHGQAATFYAKLGFKRSPTDPLHLYLLLADARSRSAADSHSCLAARSCMTASMTRARHAYPDWSSTSRPRVPRDGAHRHVRTLSPGTRATQREITTFSAFVSAARPKVS